MQNFKKYNEDFNSLTKRVEDITNYTIRLSEKISAYKNILGFIDLTALGGDDTHEKVKKLSQQAINFENKELSIPHIAAVCVYPVFARTVSEVLKKTDVKTVCVAGAFPSGQLPLHLRVKEVEYTLEQGADEIDMVISRGRLIEGDEDYVFDEISSIKAVCGETHLKVILETGELREVSLIRKACVIALLAGADFLKTSTGKIQPAATPETFLILLDSVKEYYEKTKRKIGVKPAGGIASPEDALVYYQLVEEILGENWLNNELFRIGASHLAKKVYDEIIENSKL